MRALHYQSQECYRLSITVADPGFPVGRAPTPEAAMFRKICMSKRKNQDPWVGGGAPAAPPSGSANVLPIKIFRVTSSFPICRTK